MDALDYQETGLTLDQARARWLAAESAQPLQEDARALMLAGVAFIEAGIAARIDRLFLLDVSNSLQDELDNLESVIRRQLDDAGLDYDRIDRTELLAVAKKVGG